MSTKIKKNLWWIITSIALYVPVAIVIDSISCKLDEKMWLGVLSFVFLFVVWALIGLIANKIKKTVYKVLWIILGFLAYAVCWLVSIVFIAMFEPVTEEDIQNRKEAFKEMVYDEFKEEDHLDEVVGIQLPQYTIVRSACDYVTFPPTETEYDVELDIHFPGGLSDIWDEIYDLASRKASNPHSKGKVINEWGFDNKNPEIIYYKTENESNVGCCVVFKSQCDTVYVTRYKW